MYCDKMMCGGGILLILACFVLLVDGQLVSNVIMIMTSTDPQPAKQGFSYDFTFSITLNQAILYNNLSLQLYSPIDNSTNAITRLCNVATNIIDVIVMPYQQTTRTSADGSYLWNYYYYAIGDIASGGSTEVSTQFSVVYSNPLSGGTFPVSYYAEMSNEDTLVIGYYPLDFNASESLTSYETATTSVTISGGSTTLNLNQTLTYTATVVIDKITPDVTMSVSWSHLSLTFGLSIVSLRLATWGSFWMCVETPTHLFYPALLTANQQSVGNQKASINMGKMCNRGARNASLDPLNGFLNFEFTVHVYGTDSTIIGETYALNADFTVDGTTQSVTFPVSISTTPQPSVVLTTFPIIESIPMTSLNPQLGETLSMIIKVTLPPATTDDYMIRLVPDPTLTPLQLSVLFVQVIFQGFNIPYILETPQLSNVQYSFNNPLDVVQQSASSAYLDLGFVANTGQISGNTTEDQIWFLVAFQTFNDPTLVGQTIITTVQLIYNQGNGIVPADQLWTFASPTATPLTPTSNLTLYPGVLASTQRQQRIAFMANVNFNTFQSEAGPLMNFEATSANYEICELRVIFASVTLPGMKYMVQIRDQLTSYTTINDAQLDVSRVSVSGYDSIYTQGNTFTVRAIAEAPVGLPNGVYNMDMKEFYDGTNALLAPIPVYHYDIPGLLTSVSLFATLVSSKPGHISNYETASLIVRLKLPLGAFGPYNFTVTVTDDLHICGLQVYYAGDNIPCHGVGTKHIPSIDGVGQILTMDFGVLSNVGSPASSSQFSSFNIDDDNSLTLSVAVIAKDVVNTPPLASIKVTDGSTNTMVTVQEQTTFVASSGAGPEIFYFGSTFETGNTNVVVGVIYHYKLTVLVSKSSTQNVTIQVFGPLNVIGDSVRFCSAVITSIGKNLPCLSDSIVPSYQQINGSTSNNSFILNLGYVCQSPMIQSPQISLNTFTIEFTFELLPTSNLAVGSNFQLTAVVANQTQSVTLIVASTPPSFLNLMNIWPVMSVNTDPSPVTVGIGHYQTVQFNVSIPSNNAQPMTIEVSSNLLNGTPALHIDSMRIITSGLNIPCFPTNMPLITYNSTSVPITVYMDTSVLNFGWITNTGSTYRTRAGSFPSDNVIQLEATVLVTDNIQFATDQACFLNVILNVGNTSTNGSILFQVIRSTNDTPALNFSLGLNSPQPSYSVGNNLSAQFVLSHLINTSSAEAWSVALTFYLPSSTIFLSYQSSDNNSVVTTNPGAQYIQILYPRLLFLDKLNLTLNFQLNSFTAFSMNPTVITTIPYQLDFYLLDRITGAFTRKYLPISDIRFNTIVQGCNQPIISNLSSCQIVTSSVSQESSKSFVKYGSVSYWQPELRIGDNPWVKFYFNTTPTITQVKIASLSTTYRRPLSIKVQYSDDGLKYLLSTEANLSYTSEESVITLNKPITCNYLQIVIMSADNQANMWTTYIGLQVEVYGCSSGQSQFNSLACFADQTGEIWGERQFLAFESAAAIFCHYNPKKDSRQCFLTSDGNQWINLSPKVAYIFGKDTSSGFIYGSSANQNATIVSKDFGSTWNPISATELNFAMISASFVKSLVVPYNSLNEQPFSSHSLTMGVWGAGFRGLFKVSGSTWATDPRAAWIA